MSEESVSVSEEVLAECFRFFLVAAAVPACKSGWCDSGGAGGSCSGWGWGWGWGWGCAAAVPPTLGQRCIKVSAGGGIGEPGSCAATAGDGRSLSPPAARVRSTSALPACIVPSPAFAVEGAVADFMLLLCRTLPSGGCWRGAGLRLRLRLRLRCTALQASTVGSREAGVCSFASLRRRGLAAENKQARKQARRQEGKQDVGGPGRHCGKGWNPLFFGPLPNCVGVDGVVWR